MHDPARDLDMAMDAYNDIAEEDPPAYGGNGRRLSAQWLAREMADARQMKKTAAYHEAEWRQTLEDAKANTAYIEAMAIDEWLGSIPADQLKTRYGSNDTDRTRNTTLYLETHPKVAEARRLLGETEMQHSRACAELERCRELVEHLRVLALAYGGECSREAARLQDARLLAA